MSEWVKRDLEHIWHPFTQMHDTRTMPPLYLRRARGVFLYGEQGRRYYDTISSWWCNVHGHSHPHITRAIKRQIDRLDHVLLAGFTHRPAIELAERLCARAPRGLNKVFFSDNGSTAVETAIKMSFQYWQQRGKPEKRRFLSLDAGYHGDTIGAMGISGVSLFNEVFQPLCRPSIKVPAPYCYRCPRGRTFPACRIACLGYLERAFAEHHRRIAALVIEPLLCAAGGMIVYPAAYLKGAACLARRYGVHLIADEVATGFGRTGTMFACEQGDVRPDFMCLSKGITAGTLPLGVTLTTREIFSAFYAPYERKKTFFHGHTFTGNPLACAAALASLDLFDDGALERTAPLVPYLRTRLEMCRSLPYVGDVRHIGMVGALELVRNKRSKAPFPFKRRIGALIYREGLREGIVLRPLGQVIYLFLPLCVSRRDIRVITERLFRVVSRIGTF